MSIIKYNFTYYNIPTTSISNVLEPAYYISFQNYDDNLPKQHKRQQFDAVKSISPS